MTKEDQHWDPVDLSYWQHHYGVAHPIRILLNLRRDYPEAQYRARDGRIEVLLERDDEDEQ